MAGLRLRTDESPKVSARRKAGSPSLLTGQHSLVLIGQKSSAQDSIQHTSRQRRPKGTKRSGSKKPLLKTQGSLESASQSRSRSPILISNRNYPRAEDFAVQHTSRAGKHVKLDLSENPADRQHSPTVDQWGIDVNVKAKLFKDSQIQSQAQLLANSMSRGGKSPLVQQDNQKPMSPTPPPHVPQISAIMSNQFTVEQYMKAGVGTTGNAQRSKDNSMI